MRIRYGLFARLLIRCAELAGETDAKKIVTLVYGDRLQALAETFLATHDAVSTAEGAWSKENAEATRALEALDQPYRETLAVVSAYLPHHVLPTTLKSLPTDTDRHKAIGDLLDLLDAHQGETWAAEQLAGAFGTQAPKTTTELAESLEANQAYVQARDDRAAAYGPAYERYLAFKQVVRAAYGHTSLQYHRIHPRAGGSQPGEPTPPAP